MLLCEVFVKRRFSFHLEEHSVVLAFLLNTVNCLSCKIWLKCLIQLKDVRFAKYCAEEELC